MAEKERMELANMFQYVMDHYEEVGPRVDSSTKVYKTLCKDIPAYLSNLIGMNDIYVVKGRMGSANKSECPWVAIMDRNITQSTQKGLYVVFLFAKDMKSFYLTLNQGITNFENLFGKYKYDNAEKVANYFVSQIHDVSFVSESIDLGVGRGSLGYGYARTNIVSKHYYSGRFNDQILEADIIEIMDVYRQITKHMDTASYDQVIKSVLADEDIHVTNADEAIEKIKQAVDPYDDTPYGFYRKLSEVPPKIDRSNKFRKITHPNVGKIDYLKKARKDAETGLLGEELVLQYEKERLASIGMTEYVDEIKWVSQESDRYGYDIISYDYDPSGKVVEIKIEVKTTSSKVDTEFYVSKNELEKSHEFESCYCIYRVYDAKSENPKFYRAFGAIEENFILDPVTWMARYKFPIYEYDEKAV